MTDPTTTDTPNPLMHCPFCDNPDVRIETDGRVTWVDCGDCDAQGPSAETAEEALDLWGYRHEGKLLKHPNQRNKTTRTAK
jgi:hypothetical protein